MNKISKPLNLEDIHNLKKGDFVKAVDIYGTLHANDADLTAIFKVTSIKEEVEFTLYSGNPRIWADKFYVNDSYEDNFSPLYSISKEEAFLELI